MRQRQRPIDEKEIEYAYNLWFFRNFPFRKEEQFLEPFLNETIRPCLTNRSWLKICRESSQLTSSSIAKKLDITRQGYESYEIAEENKTITLAKLMEAAEAVGCELVYVIRPKERKKFSRLIWEKTLPRALEHPWLTKCDQRKKAHALCYIVTRLIKNPKFRKEQSWSKHKN